MAKLFVIAGHGAGDPGAVGNGYTEAERVRALASRIKALGGDNVMLGDTNRNWYADKGISSLNISKDYQIIELHMDSAAASARGGHVIIKAGFTADAYDNALASMLKSILPGRSSMIVSRSDLANPNRAAAKGYGYRLVEFGFISNATDVQIFNSRMDDIARGVLNAFGIKATSSGSSSSSGASSSTGSAETYELVTTCKVYMNASNAKNRSNSVGSYDAGTYYVYNKADGMINVTKTKGTPGGWINPNDNRKESTSSFSSYKVKVDIANLRIRKGPGTNYESTGKYTGKGVFTIVAESSGTGATKWGKLKSGAGWISLDYAEKV